MDRPLEVKVIEICLRVDPFPNDSKCMSLQITVEESILADGYDFDAI